jgi:hypothetical protein
MKCHIFDFSIALITMPLDKSCNASAFVSRSSQCISFFRSLFNQSAHTQTHPKNTCARAQGESEVSIVLIVPSRQMPWRNVEGALFWELDVILFWDTIHREILRRVLKKTFNVQGWGCLFRGGAFVWQSRVYIQKPFKVRGCFRGGVQSNRFHCRHIDTYTNIYRYMCVCMCVGGPHYTKKSMWKFWIREKREKTQSMICLLPFHPGIIPLHLSPMTSPTRSHWINFSKWLAVGRP